MLVLKNNLHCFWANLISISLLFTMVSVLVVPVLVMADSELEFIYQIPDFNQTQVLGESFGDGQQFCAPVAVSNSLQWLMPEQFNQIDVIKILASKNHMNTRQKNGSDTASVLHGVDHYVTEVIGGYKKLKYQGWHLHRKKYSTKTKVPSLNWIVAGVKSSSAVWLNIGWYQHNKEEALFQRIGDHWVTLVGYDFEDGKQQLIFHDPSSRSGKSFANEYVNLLRIKEGTLTGKKKILPVPAEGYYILDKGMHLQIETDVAIIDGAILLEL